MGEWWIAHNSAVHIIDPANHFQWKTAWMLHIHVL